MGMWLTSINAQAISAPGQARPISKAMPKNKMGAPIKLHASVFRFVALLMRLNERSQRWRRPSASEFAKGVHPPPFAALAGSPPRSSDRLPDNEADLVCQRLAALPVNSIRSRLENGSNSLSPVSRTCVRHQRPAPTRH